MLCLFDTHALVVIPDTEGVPQVPRQVKGWVRHDSQYRGPRQGDILVAEISQLIN